MPEILSYVTSFSITYLLSPLVMLATLLRLNKSNSFDQKLLCLISSAIGPTFISLLLYYFYLLVHFTDSIMYLASVLLILSVISITVKQYFRPAIELIRSFFVVWSHKKTLLTVFIAGLLVAQAYIVTSLPILGNDVLIYGTKGKLIFTQNKIEYNSYWAVDSETGFFNSGKDHGLTFPLIGTWGRIVNNVFGAKGDYFFRSVTSHYWILFILLFYYYLSKHNEKFANVFSLLLILSPGITYMFFYYHIDTLRLFFFLATFITFLEYLKRQDKVSVILLGILSGFAINIHSSNAILISGILISLIIFAKAPVSRKIIDLLSVIILAILFGGIHYIFETFFGTGWLFSKFLEIIWVKIDSII